MTLDIPALALEYGAINLRFFIPMSRLTLAGIIPGIAFRNHDAPREIVECFIDETAYKVLDNYKVKLAAVDPAFGSEKYYISDLETIMQANPTEYSIHVLTIDGYRKLF